MQTYPTADLPALILLAPMEANEDDFVELRHPAGTRFRVLNNRPRLEKFAKQLSTANNACKRKRLPRPRPKPMTRTVPNLKPYLDDPDSLREFITAMDAPLEHVVFGAGRYGPIPYISATHIIIEGVDLILARCAEGWRALHDCGLSVAGPASKPKIPELARAMLHEVSVEAGKPAAELVAREAAKAGHTQQSLLAQYLHTGIKELI